MSPNTSVLTPVAIGFLGTALALVFCRLECVPVKTLTVNLLCAQYCPWERRRARFPPNAQGKIMDGTSAN